MPREKLYLIHTVTDTDSVCVFGIVRCVVIFHTKPGDPSCKRHHIRFLMKYSKHPRECGLFGNMVIRRGLSWNCGRMFADLGLIIQEMM